MDGKIKIFIFSLFLCVFLSISCISANDLNDTDIEAISDASQLDDNILESDEDIEAISDDSSIEDNILESDGSDELKEMTTVEASTFGELSGNIGTETIINIKNNITFEDVLSFSGTDLTINGNGFTFDGQNSNGFFSIDGAGVTFQNIIFKNSVNCAVYCHQSVLCSFVNCTFINNSATYWAGAIQFHEAEGASIINCTFINNSAAERGGAINIYEGSGFKIEGCNFSGNSAGNGGAVYTNTDAKVIISNSNFTENNATTGGAIYSVSGASLSIDNCIFKNNTAANGGGIFSQGTLTVSDSNFTDNSITGNDGGAVYTNDISVFTSCVFSNNLACFGPAIYTLINSTINDCEFINNNASEGAVIYSRYVLNVSDSKFANNVAKRYGGAIGAYGENELTLSRCDFTNNTAMEYDTYDYGGGAVFVAGGSANYVSDCNFTGNAAYAGGAIFIKSGIASDFSISNCNFINNNASVYGGAIYFSSSTSGCVLNVSNSNFVNNKALNNTGGAVFSNSPKSIILNSNFTGNFAKNGGALYFSKSVAANVSNSNFNNNNASSGGGAVYFNGADSIVASSNFTGNSAKYGGAVYFNNADDRVENSNFVNNNASASGGAVYINSDDGTVVNSNFTGNSAKYGGAVYISKSGTCDISNSDFTNNSATTGGAFYALQTSQITNSRFAGNTAKYRHIYSNSSLTSTDNEFDVYISDIQVSNNTYGSNATVTGKFDAGIINMAFSGIDLIIADKITKTVDVDENGIFSFTLDAFELDAGKYNITSSFIIESNNYTVTSTESFEIIKPSLTVTFLSNVSVTYGENDTITVTGNISDAFSGIINVSIAGSGAVIFNDAVSVSNGSFTAQITDRGVLAFGTYDIVIVCENYTFTESVFKDYVTVNKRSIEIISADSIEVSYGTNNTVTLSGKLNTTLYGVDYNGVITVNVNDKNFTADAGNGTFNVNITGVDTWNAGSYVLTISGAETENYTAVNPYSKSKLTIQSEANITGSDLVMFYLQDTSYGITLVDDDGNPIAGVNVTFTVNGVSYNVTTDNNGYAYLDINLRPGTYTIVTEYAQSNPIVNISRNITIKHALTAKKTTKVKKSAKKTVVSILATGQQTSLTKNVKFKYKGKAKVKVSFGADVKKQTVKVTYKGKTYNVKVNKNGKGTLKLTKKVAKKLKKGKKYKVNVAYTGGKPYKNIKVTVKFNGKAYSIKTNKYGVGKFKVTKKMVKKLKAGKKYKYTATYQADSITKYIKIKK